MLWSRALIPTMKEVPSDAEIPSHRLLLRAGMMRRVGSGLYTMLPLGWRSVLKVEAIVREEMNRAGAQEVRMPVLSPEDLWKETGRWDVYGKEMMRMEDRHGRFFALGPTHEEVITDLIRTEVSSYRQLPVNLYQIQTKFRDEIRPRFGLMRAREFGMKDAYSFHETEDCLAETYRKMHEAYTRIFTRCGLEFRVVEADSGAIGGEVCHEFMVLAESGEATILFSEESGYCASDERADRLDPGGESPEGSADLAEVDTPGLKSVDEVAAFLGVEPGRLVKTLVYETEDGPVVALVSGDRDVNEGKLARFLGKRVELASPEVITRVTKAPVGFAGPVGLSGVRVIADYSVRGIADGVTGANREDAHFTGVNPGRDFDPDDWCDIATARAGDLCPRGGGPMQAIRGIEVGHIFKLGTKYSGAMGAQFLDKDGKNRTSVMGCYGIGTTRTVAAAVEQNHDENGIIWPVALAPYEVTVTPVKAAHEESMIAARTIADALPADETLLDDRSGRPGAKFKDADLVGSPVRVTIGERNLAEGLVEVRRRRDGQVEKVSVESAPEVVARMLNEETPRV
ncbi:MAG: proline--tRNA ligase [Gemmatimonadota bacterium]|jgi:prolyl-tRNA synthetase|nr:proline--tRNA ligase [Gemmatimonadota bacterium]MDP6802116.1 proline--tRNA ligase [Gemmatimonadota bacterium]MDP7032051.1 proline--tRNA ligase [Gemmatimonadota bacterium]